MSEGFQKNSIHIATGEVSIQPRVVYMGCKVKGGSAHLQFDRRIVQSTTPPIKYQQELFIDHIAGIIKAI